MTSSGTTNMTHKPQTDFVVIGVDPDTFSTGIAMLSGRLRDREIDIRIERVAVAAAKHRQIRSRLVQLLDSIDDGLCEMINSLDQSIVPDLVVVEGQAFRPGDPRPDDIVQLAVAQGMAAGVGKIVGREVLMPLPVQWKGTVAKADHQARLLRDLGLDAGLDEVPGAAPLSKVQRGHVIDAIGLARWGLEEMAKRERKARMLG